MTSECSPSEGPYPTTNGKDPTEEQINEVASKLEFIEEWLATHDVAGSALGRQVLQDQAAISRWRASGSQGCSPEKRRALAVFVLTHPDGLPGYTRGKQGRRKPSNRKSAAFTIDRTPSSSRVGDLNNGGRSSAVPVPALSELDADNDIAYIKHKAFTTGQPIARILAGLVQLGIMVERETDESERNN